MVQYSHVEQYLSHAVYCVWMKPVNQINHIPRENNNIWIKCYLDGHGKGGNVIGDIAGSLACFVKKEKDKKERTKRKKNKVC